MLLTDVDQILSLVLKVFILIEVLMKVSSMLAPFAAYMWNGVRDRLLMLWDPRAFARNIAYEVYREEEFVTEIRLVGRRARRQPIAN